MRTIFAHGVRLLTAELHGKCYLWTSGELRLPIKDVACIHDLFIRYGVMLCSAFLNAHGHFHILHIGNRRLHRRKGIRQRF